MLKKTDILLILFLFCLSFVPLALRQDAAPAAVYADITLDGRLVRRVALSAHKGTETFSLATPDGHQNTICLTDNAIAVTDADCPDKLCIKTGAVSRPGDVIACLPHKLLIEVKGSGTDHTGNTDSQDARTR